MNNYSIGMLAGSGVFNSLSGYFGARTNSYLKQAELYQQAGQDFKVISARIREEMNRQGASYLQNGVDVSQGTALYVITHKNMQGQMAMAETRENLEINVRNAKRIGCQEANARLFGGLAQTGLETAGRIYENKLMDARLGRDGKKENLFESPVGESQQTKKAREYVWVDPTTHKGQYKKFGSSQWLKKDW